MLYYEKLFFRIIVRNKLCQKKKTKLKIEYVCSRIKCVMVLSWTRVGDEHSKTQKRWSTQKLYKIVKILPL